MRLPLPQPLDSAAAPRDTVAAAADTVRDSVAVAAPADTAVAPASLVEAVRRALTESGPLGSPPKTEAAAEPPGAVAQTWAWLVGTVRDATGLPAGTADALLLTIAVVAALWALRVVVLWVVRRGTRDVRLRYRWRKISSYVAYALGAVALLRIWIGALGAFATFFGLLTAGLAIALRDPLVNVAGWLFIVWKRPFGPGDRITIRTHTGDVIDQRLFQFTLLEVGTATGAYQSTGRLVHVPNGWVFMDSVVNASRGFQYIWNEVPVRVTFESDWRAAKRLLQGIADEHANPLSADAERTLRRAAREYMIFYSKLTPTVYTAVRDWGVELTLRYLVEPRRVRGSEQVIWEAVLDAFEAHERIDFAYPTSRVVRTPEEGKPALRPPDYVPPHIRDEWGRPPSDGDRR